jgi:hypothetical protein
MVSNLKHKLREYLAKIRVIKYWIEHGKIFLENDRADLKSFTYATRNIDSQLRF